MVAILVAVLYPIVVLVHLIPKWLDIKHILVLPLHLVLDVWHRICAHMDPAQEFMPGNQNGLHLKIYHLADVVFLV